MTSHSLLVAVFVVSYVALSTCNSYNTTILTYSPRVLNTTSQGGCPPDAQRETVIEEVKEDIRNLLQHVRKWTRNLYTAKLFRLRLSYVASSVSIAVNFADSWIRYIVEAYMLRICSL